MKHLLLILSFAVVTKEAMASSGKPTGCLGLNLPNTLFPPVSIEELKQTGVVEPDQFGAACRDSSGMIWGGLAQDDKGMPLLLSPQNALEHCKKIGAELPSGYPTEANGFNGFPDEDSDWERIIKFIPRNIDVERSFYSSSDASFEHSVDAVFSFIIREDPGAWVTPLKGNPGMYALTVCVVRPNKQAAAPKEPEPTAAPSLRPLKLSFEPLNAHPVSDGLEAIPVEKTVPILLDIYEHRSPKEQGQVVVTEDTGSTYSASLMSQSAGTIAHELSHGIHSHIEKENPGYAGFYVPTKGFLKIKKPQALRVHIAAFIPTELRGLEGQGRRFHQYLEDQFGNEPLAGTPMVHYGPGHAPTPQWRACNALYLWDEWRSYLNGALTALQAEKMFGRVGFDYLTGPAEFFVYALGSMMAIKEVDPVYYGSPAFEIMKDTFWYFTRETLQIIKEGAGTSLAPELAESHLATLFHSESTRVKAMRTFLESEFGSDWKNQLLDPSGHDFIPKIKAAKKVYSSNKTRITLTVPADAKVFFEGYPTTTKGVVRRFAGSWLKKGETRPSYEIKVVLRRENREHVVVQTIDLVGGQLRELDFFPHFAPYLNSK